MPERLPRNVSPSARIYLRPVDIFGGAAAVAMVKAQSALPIGGGPLAFLACEVAIRDGGAITRSIATLGELGDWAARVGGLVADRVTGLLDRIASTRVDRRIDPRRGPALMGIINVTPDSFSDGGAHLAPAAALSHAAALAGAGADILDVGGESTRPGATPVAVDEELRRVTPVLAGIEEIRRAHPGIRVSIDTRRAAVMRAALSLGVDLINDVTALAGDADSMAVAAASNAAIVLMHMRGEPATMNLAPSYHDVALDVFDHLEQRITACREAGIDRNRLIVDPGIGFAKRGAHNRAVLRSLALFHGLGCPILLGVSRKGLGGEPERSSGPKDRLPVSLAAAIHAASQGVQILRVHDVAETRRALDLWDRLNGAAD